MPVTWPAVPSKPSKGSWATWACAASGAPGPRAPRAARRGSSARPDLVKRHFEAFAPGGLWVADIPPQAGGAPSYVRTFSGLLRLGLRGFRDRRVLPENHRLADLHEPVHQPGPGRPENGRLATKTSGGRPDGPGASLRPRRAVQVYSLRGRPCPSARRSPRWVPRGGTPFGFALAEALNSLYKAELNRNQGPWEDIDVARARYRRVGSLVRAPSGLTPLSACTPQPSTKPPGHLTSARIRLEISLLVSTKSTADPTRASATHQTN